MKQSQVKEIEQWARIARLFDKVAAGTVGRWSAGGICRQIQQARVSSFVKRQMRRRMREYHPKGRPYGFWWPVSADGGRCRAAFARQMARLVLEETIQ